MEAVLSDTKKSLAPIVKTTPVTDKLLSRPPFRYLHDLTMEIIQTTGFGQSLFSDKERDSQNVTDKEQKLEFLQKLISFVEQESGQKVRAKPAKIIAGLEAEETNAFIQLLATTAIQKRQQHSSSKVVPKQKSSPRGSLNNVAEASAKKKAVTKKKPEKTLPKVENETKIDTVKPEPQILVPTVISAVPTVVVAPPRVIKEDDQKEDEVDLVILPQNTTLNQQQISSSNEPFKIDGNHGGLVKKILETNAKLTDGDGIVTSASSTTQRQKERDATRKEMEALREFLQSVSRNTAPLNGLLDYFQEDIDSMMKEMDYWKHEYTKASKQLEIEQQETEKIMYPMRVKSVQIDEQIQEAVLKIHEMKAKVFENDQLIQKLLLNIVGK